MSTLKLHKNFQIVCFFILTGGIMLTGCEKADKPGSIGLYPPQNLTASAMSATEIILQWSPSEIVPSGAMYRVYRDGTPVIIIDGTQYTDRGLQQTTTYTYTVRLIDALGSVSEPSNPIEATTREAENTAPPATPEGLVAEPQSPSSISLAWNWSTGDVRVVGYRLFRDGIELAALEHPKKSYMDWKLSPATTYEYRVLAYDVAGNVSLLSDPVTATTPGLDTVAPTAPASLSAAASGQSTIDLVWDPSTDNDRVARYQIYRDGAFVTATVGTDHRDAGLDPNTDYTYTVTAVDAAGNESGHSNQASAATLQAPDAQAPTPPASLSAAASGQSTIDLVWDPSTDNDRVTWYRIYRNGVLVGATGRTDYRSHGLSPGTSYTFTVTAVDPAGNESGHSNQASAATLN